MGKYYKDLIERVAWTAIQAFLAVFMVGNVNSAKAGGIAAAAAVLSLLKGVAATRVGDPESAATLK